MKQLTIGDSPHAESVARLTIPFTSTLFTPWIIPKRSWTKFGIDASHIVKYHALDPFVWINSPNKDPGFKLPKERIITVRLEESEAAYLSHVEQVGLRVIQALCEKFNDHCIVALPRYRSQRTALKALPVVMPPSAFDGVALLKRSDVFIGLGGTMTVEAAMLGVPCISAYPGDSLFTEQFLLKQGLIVKGLNIEEILRTTSRFLHDSSLRKILRRKAEALRERMVNPVEVILRHPSLKNADKS